LKKLVWQLYNIVENDAIRIMVIFDF